MPRGKTRANNGTPKPSNGEVVVTREHSLGEARAWVKSGYRPALIAARTGFTVAELTAPRVAKRAATATKRVVVQKIKPRKAPTKKAPAKRVMNDGIPFAELKAFAEKNNMPIPKRGPSFQPEVRAAYRKKHPTK